VIGLLFFEPFDVLQPEFKFIVIDALFDVILPVAQHAVDEPSKMISYGNDCLGRTKSGFSGDDILLRARFCYESGSGRKVVGCQRLD
jgi:hypothetical protein